MAIEQRDSGYYLIKREPDKDLGGDADKLTLFRDLEVNGPEDIERHAQVLVRRLIAEQRDERGTGAADALAWFQMLMTRYLVAHGRGARKAIEARLKRALTDGMNQGSATVDVERIKREAQGRVIGATYEAETVLPRMLQRFMDEKKSHESLGLQRDVLCNRNLDARREIDFVELVRTANGELFRLSLIQAKKSAMAPQQVARIHTTHRDYIAHIIPYAEAERSERLAELAMKARDVEIEQLGASFDEEAFIALLEARAGGEQSLEAQYGNVLEVLAASTETDMNIAIAQACRQVGQSQALFHTRLQKAAVQKLLREGYAGLMLPPGNEHVVERVIAWGQETTIDDQELAALTSYPAGFVPPHPDFVLESVVHHGGGVPSIESYGEETMGSRERFAA